MHIHHLHLPCPNSNAIPGLRNPAIRFISSNVANNGCTAAAAAEHNMLSPSPQAFSALKIKAMPEKLRHGLCAHQPLRRVVLFPGVRHETFLLAKSILQISAQNQ